MITRNFQKVDILKITNYNDFVGIILSMDHERYFQNKLSEFEAEENIAGRITNFYPNTLYVAQGHC